MLHRLIAICLLGLGFALPAHAAESYDNCTGFVDSLPATISTQGTWCLRHDVSTAITSGNAIIVATNNVTLDCNNFKVGGLAAGVGTGTYGILAENRYNLTVRNCNIRGFYWGIDTESGGGHVIERNSLDSNTYVGMGIFSPGSTVRNNIVVDTGGTSQSANGTYGIYVSGGVDIIDNTVNGLTMAGGTTTIIGISFSSNATGSVIGNRVKGLATGGTAYGIYNFSSGHDIVRDNNILGPEDGTGTGILCQGNKTTARDNVVAGFGIGVSAACYSFNNAVNPN